MNHSEVLSIDVPATQPNGQFHDVPWEWFGVGKADPSWGTLFDEIEQKRNETRDAD